MLRSASQVLYSYLPGAIFRHEDRVYGQVLEVTGERVTSLNTAVVFEEVASALEAWREEDRINLPLPRGDQAREYIIYRPEQVIWEIYPLVFECVRSSCGRVRSYLNPQQLADATKCRRCGGAMRQLRFYSAHNCGHIQPMRVAPCQVHGYDDIYFENTGSFITATWRCRGKGCDGRVVSRTNQSPCSRTCQWVGRRDNTARMRAHTLDDSRAYYVHAVDLVNIRTSTFEMYQRHPDRGSIAVAHYLGLITGLRHGLSEADKSTGPTERLTADEWAKREANYRAMGLPESDIAVLRKQHAPADAGLAGLGDLAPGVVDRVAIQRPFIERAAVFDPEEIKRMSLSTRMVEAQEAGDQLHVSSLASALELSSRMGIEDLAVTWDFPIAKVSYGFSRESRAPDECSIRGFRTPSPRTDRYPLFAVASETEALLVTLRAVDVMAFLMHRGLVPHAPASEGEAKRQLLALFADADANPDPPEAVRTLLHTFAHLLLRGLDDGQVGFAESSLAEWLVPEALTLGVYANSLKAFTLGSLWTLLNNRALTWLRGVVQQSIHCENDPLCYRHKPRACERCAYITFGCRQRNESLDRELLADYFKVQGVLSALTS